MNPTRPQLNQDNLVSLELPSIEGTVIRLDGQKISLNNPPRRVPGLSDQVVFAVTSKGSGRGEIIEAYADKIPKVCSKAQTTSGSQVFGACVFGYSVEPLRKSDIEKGGDARSGRHTRQYVNLEGGALATVLKNSLGILVSRHPSEILEISATDVGVSAYLPEGT